MKIYTRTGDSGTTALFGGQRLPKSDIRIEAYGTVDELNSHIGLLRDQPVNSVRTSILLEIQDRLFAIGAILAAEPGNAKIKIPKLNTADVDKLETHIDDMESGLSEMKSFILPGGHPSVSFGHIARTVCRRAERRVEALNQRQPVDPLVIQYLNRLSDFLFVLCRKMAAESGAQDIPWRPSL